MNAAGRYLVTGANGHVGANLVRELIARGAEVRALVRPNSDTRSLANLPVDLQFGQVTSSEDLLRVGKGIEGIFHLAAPTLLTSDLEATIRQGTKCVLESARANEVRRVVVTSSAVTTGFSESPDQILSETKERFLPASPYHIAKYKMERELLNEAPSLASEVVIVCPATVVGRLDFKTTPSSMVAHLARRKPLRWWFESGVTLAPVQNVARGHLAAMLHGVRGRKYILGGEPLRIESYFSLLNQINDRKARLTRLPMGLMLSAGILFSGLEWAGWKKVPFDYRRIRSLLGNYGFYSSDRAREELGYEVGTASEAIRDYYGWLDEKQGGA